MEPRRTTTGYTEDESSGEYRLRNTGNDLHTPERSYSPGYATRVSALFTRLLPFPSRYSAPLKRGGFIRVAIGKIGDTVESSYK